MVMHPSVLKRLDVPGDGQIGEFTTAYMQSEAKLKGNALIRSAFMESGLTVAQLARRLGWDHSRLTRVLNLSTNLTLETMGELYYAITGKAIAFGPRDILAEATEYAAAELPKDASEPKAQPARPPRSRRKASP